MCKERKEGFWFLHDDYDSPCRLLIFIWFLGRSVSLYDGMRWDGKGFKLVFGCISTEVVFHMERLETENE